MGLSGGVDSAVTAVLLKERGYEVVGVYLDAWEHSGCEVDKDRRDALLVASKLKIPFKVLDVKREYKRRVVDYFFETYKQGLTPNPDILCNSEIKFGIFYDWAMKQGFEMVATGHYARVASIKMNFAADRQRIRSVEGTGPSYAKFRLLQRGRDKKKDQSYFLWRVEPDRLKRILFPLGEKLKGEVRLKAKELKLPVANKPDSMGVCFIGEIDVRKMLEEKLGEKEGEVVMGGVVVGKHRGLWFYTIGQRGGFEVDKKKLRELGLQPEKMKPLYVIGKDLEKNRLVVGEKREAFSSRFTVYSPQLFVEGKVLGQLVEKGEIFVRIRNLGELYGVSGFSLNSPLAKRSLWEFRGSAPIRLWRRGPFGSFRVKTREKVFGVAPGQSAVFYWRWNEREGEEIIVGGGEIGV